MTIAQICLLVACLLPMGCALLAKSKGLGKRRRDGGFDNNRPREWLAQLDGWRWASSPRAWPSWAFT